MRPALFVEETELSQPMRSIKQEWGAGQSRAGLILLGRRMASFAGERPLWEERTEVPPEGVGEGIAGWAVVWGITQAQKAQLVQDAWWGGGAEPCLRL